MVENNKIIYFSTTIMLFIYILSLTPGLSSNFIKLFNNYFINLFLLISIIIFSKINQNITLLLLISYCGTFIYIKESNTIESMKNLYNNLYNNL